MAMGPSTDADVSEVDPALLVDETIDLVRRWLRAAAAVRDSVEEQASERLQELVEDEAGLAFTMAFVDRVIRPDDDRVAAAQLRQVAGRGAPLPRFLGRIDRLLLRSGALLAPALPRVVMPLARRRMRQIVGHLVVDADEKARRAHLRRRRNEGFSLNVNLLGEAVLGEREAQRRLDATLELLGDDDVDYVSVKISGVASQIQPWAWDASLDRISERLRTVFRAAMVRDTFVNLDMEEYRDLELTSAAFRRVLDEPEFDALEAGIVLQAYLPDAPEVLEALVGWATERHARTGAGIKIRLVKGANLAMERVDAAMHGWRQAPYVTKAETDANYKRCLDWLLDADRLRAVRVGVGSHNLFDLAWATLLAAERGVTGRVGVEMLEGMSPADARVIRDDGSSLLLYTPVVDPSDFDVAISYLFRRLEENAAPGNFLRALADLRPDSPAFDEQARRFRDAVADRHTVETGRRRSVDRSAPTVSFGTAPFRNEPESDPTHPGTRRWAVDAVARRPEPVRTPPPASVDDVDAAISRARRAQHEWVQLPPSERRNRLRRVADELATARGDLLTVMVHEGRKTVAQADPEICEAIDFARYYADRVTDLDAEHARFEPYGVVAVVPPWNFPVAIPTGGMSAALAAGNAALVKPAPEVPRCAEVVVECCHRAGIPADLLQLVRAPENEIGRRLVTAADAVILTGGSETAALFHSWRPDLRLHAETSGKNAMVITPNADMDLAVRDLVASAFGHAGQKCSAASLAICVGGVARDDRFVRQLVDAVTSLDVGPPDQLTTTVGPLIGPPNERLARAFATLDDGEEWLVAPERVSDDPPLWRPGVRRAVSPDSWFRATECFGPVLGLVEVDDLDHAIEVQNASDYGLTGGIQSLDPDEVRTWTERVEVGNAYVNRGITGAIVRRQPFGGWKRSSVGPGAKAGGPNYVASLGTWRPSSPLRPEVWEASDQHWWRTEFGVEHDPTALFCESNVFRYRPLTRMCVRVAAGSDGEALERVRHAAATCGVALVESHGDEENDPSFAVRLPELGVERVRVLGPLSDEVREAAHNAGIHLADDPVTAEGRVELQHYLREQSVTRTLHRFGNLVGAER